MNYNLNRLIVMGTLFIFLLFLYILDNGFEVHSVQSILVKLKEKGASKLIKHFIK